LNKTQALEDACAVDEKIYLLFPAGRRITVFAQQVRALTLIEALRETAWMQKANNVAVVGGGISGITAAMALHVAGLRPSLTITIFESRDQLVPLQSSCLDKNLAPHLIDWPSAKAEELYADLPILDWSAGMAGEVATDLLRQFARTGISARTSTRVKKIESDVHGVKLTIERDGAEIVEPFDAVIVAAGFGLEDKPASIKSETPSYWRVIPEKEVSLKDHTASKILISGLGDGGLIDFVLFAVPTLNHKRLCEDMTASIDVKELIERIDEIEAALWADPSTMDIDQGYAALKLDPLARQLFKPVLAKNKSFTLLTRDPGELLPTAAPLNRLAAAAMIYAIRTFAENGNSVRIVTGATLEREEDVSPDKPGGMFVWKVGGREEKAKFDLAVIRHGDTNSQAWEFDNPQITTQVEKLRERRKAATGRPKTPTLEPEMADAITERALRKLETRIRVSRDGQNVVWQGDIAIDRAGRLWPSANAVVEFTFGPQDEPDNLDLALCRLISHFETPTTLRSEHFAQWRNLINETHRRAGKGPHAPNEGIGAIEVQRHRRTGSPDVFATQLNASMDEGVLRLLGKRMKSFIDEPDSVLPVELHPGIRTKVLAAWPAWLAAVGSKGDVERDWILALFGNLLDHRGRIGRWTRVRVGPRCLDEEIVKAVIYHLAMQTLLSDFGDAAMHDNGNVARIGGTAATAHFCGSQFAVGDDQVARSIEMWEPRYPHVDFFPSALVLPNRNSDFFDPDSLMQGSPSTRILGRGYARPPIVHASRRLRLSLEAGEAEAKAELLRMLTIEYPDI
jgi:hypothetical protein